MHKFTWIVVIKILATILPSQPFLDCHFRFFHPNFLPWPEAVKKGPKEQGEKVVKSKWQPRNGCDGRLRAKKLIAQFRRICVASSKFH